VGNFVPLTTGRYFSVQATEARINAQSTSTRFSFDRNGCTRDTKAENRSQETELWGPRNEPTSPRGVCSTLSVGGNTGKCLRRSERRNLIPSVDARASRLLGGVDDICEPRSQGCVALVSQDARIENRRTDGLRAIARNSENRSQFADRFALAGHA
jgi:hypothetical protein